MGERLIKRGGRIRVKPRGVHSRRHMMAFAKFKYGMAYLPLFYMDLMLILSVNLFINFAVWLPYLGCFGAVLALIDETGDCSP